MTCGAAPCQRKRHARSCKRWHEEHPEAKANHYADVVKPYRGKHRSYQRRWRLAVRLREIRDAIRAACRQLRAVARRGLQAVNGGTDEPEQPRAITGKPLVDALEATEAMLRAMGTFSPATEPLVSAG